jgi:hypothetical protein
MPGHRLRDFELATILQIGRDARRAEAVGFPDSVEFLGEDRFLFLN